MAGSYCPQSAHSERQSTGKVPGGESFYRDYCHLLNLHFVIKIKVNYESLFFSRIESKVVILPYNINHILKILMMVQALKCSLFKKPHLFQGVK